MIIILILGVILIFFLIGNALKKSYITKLFLRDSVLVFGNKGKGKDLLFQMIIKKRRKPYYGNIRYGGAKWYPLEVKDLSCGINTFNQMISGDIKPFEPKFEEKRDVYISDCGIYFPSQYFQLLDKTHPSVPLYMALSRHLYVQNVHCNCQAINRIWDKMREQFGYYIKCVKCNVFFGRIVRQTVCVYDRYNDAFEDVRPFKPVKKKRSDEVAAEDARSRQNYGLIKEYTIWHILPNDKYNTRHFKDLMLTSAETDTSVT